MAENIVNLDKLKTNQFQNKFIADRRGTFTSVCNKILDFLYDATDRDEHKKFLAKSELTDLSDLAKRYELVRKKILENAPIEDDEVVLLILASKYIEEDMRRLANDYLMGAETLKGYIENLK